MEGRGIGSVRPPAKLYPRRQGCGDSCTPFGHKWALTDANTPDRPVSSHREPALGGHLAESPVLCG